MGTAIDRRQPSQRRDLRACVRLESSCKLPGINHENLMSATKDRDRGSMQHHRRLPVSEKGKTENLFVVGHEAIGSCRLWAIKGAQHKWAPERYRGFSGANRHVVTPQFFLSA